jgi:hypothetical protein
MSDINFQSPPEAKIALFMRRFRGRGDLYARRFESVKTGKSGYAPACANEWARGLCEKPGVTCSSCRNRKFLPLTPEIIGQHLTGKDASGRPFVLGIYPLLQDERCAWVAADSMGTPGRMMPLRFARARGNWGSRRLWSVRARARARISGGSSNNRFRPGWHASLPPRC